MLILSFGEGGRFLLVTVKGLFVHVGQDWVSPFLLKDAAEYTVHYERTKVTVLYVLLF